MGAPVVGARPPSHVAYYVALAGVVVLLLLLCCYFFYFCIKRVKELARQEYLTPAPSPPRTQPLAPPPTTSYPVQPVVRDSASAMAKLCRQLPSQPVGGTVFPTSTSPTPPVNKLPAPIITPLPTINEPVSAR
ncbi:uncharacterized protein LOC128200346 [Galleria mellonella]|uniref:Uncharacterized protein LOC128200346 n=1 Tax=Galleria mellonella TaxID=7137 RepID=A0ABM3MDH4_GALME|nr:uncharacterized protein LOC128200346 [Galleria mellonella]XP_052749468.1 uncharacterized protein LOC128200346 [Galleria mellonella]